MIGTPDLVRMITHILSLTQDVPVRVGPMSPVSLSPVSLLFDDDSKSGKVPEANSFSDRSSHKPTLVRVTGDNL